MSLSFKFVSINYYSKSLLKSEISADVIPVLCGRKDLSTVYFFQPSTPVTTTTLLKYALTMFFLAKIGKQKDVS